MFRRFLINFDSVKFYRIYGNTSIRAVYTMSQVCILDTLYKKKKLTQIDLGHR